MNINGTFKENPDCNDKPLMIQGGGFVSSKQAADILNSQAEQLERLEFLRDVVSDVISDSSCIDGGYRDIHDSTYNELVKRYKACTPKTKAELLAEYHKAADECIEAYGNCIGDMNRLETAYNAAKAAYEAAEGEG